MNLKRPSPGKNYSLKAILWKKINPFSILPLDPPPQIINGRPLTNNNTNASTLSAKAKWAPSMKVMYTQNKK